MIVKIRAGMFGLLGIRTCGSEMAADPSANRASVTRGSPEAWRKIQNAAKPRHMLAVGESEKVMATEGSPWCHSC